MIVLTMGVKTLFGYTNWRGEHSIRHVLPVQLVYGASEHHPEAQWLLRAMDLDKKEMRDFALKDIEPVTVYQGS